MRSLQVIGSRIVLALAVVTLVLSSACDDDSRGAQTFDAARVAQVVQAVIIPTVDTIAGLRTTSLLPLKALGDSDRGGSNGCQALEGQCSSGQAEYCTRDALGSPVVPIVEFTQCTVEANGLVFDGSVLASIGSGPGAPSCHHVIFLALSVEVPGVESTWVGDLDLCLQHPFRATVTYSDVDGLIILELTPDGSDLLAIVATDPLGDRTVVCGLDLETDTVTCG